MKIYSAMKYVFILLIVFMFGCSVLRPKFDCLYYGDNKADTSHFVTSKTYQGFIFSESYIPMIQIENNRFTPTTNNIHNAELILNNTYQKYKLRYKRQYLGCINANSDSIILIRLLKDGFKYEDCFDRIVCVGLGDYYEKYQRFLKINLSKDKVE